MKVTRTGLPLPVRPEPLPLSAEERPLRAAVSRVVGEEETGVVVLGVLVLAGLELLLLNRDSAGLLLLPLPDFCWRWRGWETGGEWAGAVVPAEKGPKACYAAASLHALASFL